MDAVSQQLLDLADRYDREIAAKREKREKLDREIEELHTKSKALRLSAKELEAAAEAEDGEERGKNSASEFREVAIRLLSTEPAGLHHKEFRERLAKQGHPLEEKQARVLVYNLARQFDKTFEVKKGTIRLLKKAEAVASPNATSPADDPFGEAETTEPSKPPAPPVPPAAPPIGSQRTPLPQAPPQVRAGGQSPVLRTAPPQVVRQTAPPAPRPVPAPAAQTSRPTQPQPTRVLPSQPPAQAAPNGGVDEDDLPF